MKLERLLEVASAAYDVGGFPVDGDTLAKCDSQEEAEAKRDELEAKLNNH